MYNETKNATVLQIGMIGFLEGAEGKKRDRNEGTEKDCIVGCCIGA